MRIVHIASVDCRGGAARAAFRLHQGLQRAGHASSMLVKTKYSNDRTVRLGRRSVNGQRTWELIEERCINLNRAPISNTYFSLDQPGCNLARHSLVKKADVIHLHWVAGFQSVADIASLQSLGKPIVWTLHDQRPLSGGCHFSAGCRGYETSCRPCPQLIDDSFALPGATLADALNLLQPEEITVVAPSRWLADVARGSALFHKSKVEWIPYGIETDVFRPKPKIEARKQFGLSPDRHCILFGADTGLEKRKGFQHFVEAIRACRLAEPAASSVPQLGCEVITFGDPVWYPIGSPVRSLGNLQSDLEMSLAYSAADLLVLPSLEDNLPNTILEALSCGTPVVAFATGGIPDLVLDGFNGKLVPVGDSQRLGETISQLLSNAEALHALGMNGRELIEQKYSLAAQAESYVALYESLLLRPKHRRAGAAPPMPIGPTLLAAFRSLILKLTDDMQREHVSDQDLELEERELRWMCLRNLKRILRTGTLSGKNYPRVLRESDRALRVTESPQFSWIRITNYFREMVLADLASIRGSRARKSRSQSIGKA